MSLQVAYLSLGRWLPFFIALVFCRPSHVYLGSKFYARFWQLSSEKWLEIDTNRFAREKWPFKDQWREMNWNRAVWLPNHSTNYTAVTICNETSIQFWSTLHLTKISACFSMFPYYVDVFGHEFLSIQLVWFCWCLQTSNNIDWRFEFGCQL